MYCVYVTDCLQAIAKNTTNHIVMGVDHPITVGAAINIRWHDLMKDISATKKKTTKSGEDLAAEVIKKAGLTLKDMN